MALPGPFQRIGFSRSRTRWWGGRVSVARTALPGSFQRFTIFLLRASLSSSESSPLHVKSFIIVIRRLVNSSCCPWGHQSQQQQTHPEHIYVCMY